MGYIPAELHSVEVEFRKASTVTHGGSPCHVVSAGLRGVLVARAVGNIGAVGVGLYRDGDIFIDVGGGRKVYILVRRVGGVEIAVKIGGIVRID